jgi:hypothetical protein
MACIGVSIDYCVSIGRTDILFADIYSKFKRADGATVFLELLEPYILNDRLPTLSPETMKDFVAYCAQRGRLQQLEQCIMHLDILVLDFHQVVTLCQTHALFSALCYVYNRGGVFGVPVEEMMAFLLDPKTGTRKRLAHSHLHSRFASPCCAVLCCAVLRCLSLTSSAFLWGARSRQSGPSVNGPHRLQMPAVPHVWSDRSGVAARSAVRRAAPARHLRCGGAGADAVRHRCHVR